MPKPKEEATVTTTAPEPIVMVDGMEPVKVQVKLGVDFKPEDPRSRYWCGVVKDFSGYAYIGVAGVNFNQITDPPRVSRDGTTTTRNQYLGAIESLTQEDVEKIVDRVKKKVVRGGKIQNLDNVHMRPLPGDVPLARYLYMVRLPDGYAPNRDVNGECPEPMAQES